MMELRAREDRGDRRRYPARRGRPRRGELLVVSWGSTYGPVAAAVEEVRQEGGPVAHLHLRHLNPFPANLGEVLSRYQASACAGEQLAGSLRIDAPRPVPRRTPWGLCKVEGRAVPASERSAARSRRFSKCVS